MRRRRNYLVISCRCSFDEITKWTWTGTSQRLTAATASPFGPAIDIRCSHKCLENNDLGVWGFIFLGMVSGWYSPNWLTLLSVHHTWLGCHSVRHLSWHAPLYPVSGIYWQLLILQTGYFSVVIPVHLQNVLHFGLMTGNLLSLLFVWKPHTDAFVSGFSFWADFIYAL